jgi:hypothetical protein
MALRSEVKRFIKEIHGLTWTLAGTGMVLITLSGKTLSLGVWITLAGVGVHFLGLLVKGDDSD